MSPFLSIITPFYNSEKTLNEAVTSILEQNFDKKLYEIILVNDNSKDKSVNIGKNLSSKNRNIFLINNKKNRGVSFSRNTAIKKAKGKYIIFLDSDDTLKANALKGIYKKIKNNNIDLLYSNKDLKKNEIIDNEKALKVISDLKDFRTYCWSFIIKRSVLVKYSINFDNIRIFEDQNFVTKIIFISKKLVFTKKCYHKHNESFNSLSKKTNYLAAYSCLRVIYNFIKQYEKERVTINQKRFVDNRIEFMYKNFKIYLLTLNQNQIKKISFKIKKTFFNLKNIKFKKLHLLFSRKINLEINQYIINKKNNLKKQILLPKHKKDLSIKNFIFCCGNYGRFLSRFFIDEKISLDGFIDNNQNLWNKRYFNLRIYSPNILSKELIKNSRLFIGHHDPKIISIILRQLNKLNVVKKNIKKINFII